MIRLATTRVQVNSAYNAATKVCAMTIMTRGQVVVSSAVVASACLLTAALYFGVIRPIDRAPVGGPGAGALMIASGVLSLGILVILGTVGTFSRPSPRATLSAANARRLSC